MCENSITIYNWTEQLYTKPVILVLSDTMHTFVVKCNIEMLVGLGV